MSSTKFDVLDWAAKGNDLLARAKRALTSAASDNARSLAERIPSAILSEDKSVVVVFAGQYSAGKSTLMKVLTGREDIATGAGITTERAHSYDWSGVKIVDTPGVHTELRHDHDDITYRAIADADLVVFVVTNELFDSHLAEHFRTLAIERDKAHEMLLVVNKMRRCASGNTADAQKVIREDLRKVLTPFTPEDLRTSFTDAEAAVESKAESDDAVARILWKKSGIDAFVEELNRFVREKGIAGRYTTALYALEQVLQESLAAESTGDTDIDALEELLLQRRRALVETQARVPRAVEGEIQRVGSQIREEGRHLAEMINGSAKKKDVDRELQLAQERVQEHARQLGESVQRVIGKHIADLAKRIEGIATGELARELLERLTIRIGNAGISPETLSKLQQASDVSSRLGEFLVRNSFTSKSAGLGGLFKLNQYSGTATHSAVKAIGDFFGKSFKPWEAVKWTRAIANAGRVLAVAGTVLTFILQIKEDADAKQLETDLRDSRAAVRSGFNEAAHALEMHYDQATATYLATTITVDIDSVDKQLAELRDMQRSKTELFRTLLGYLEETQAMIREIHASAVVE